MSYLKDREIWLSNVPTGNPPAGYFWKFIQNGKVVVRDSSGNDQMMVATSGSQAITGSLTVTEGITGTVSSASYVEYSNVANKPALVSGSEQITYSGLTGIPSGIMSGSAQIADFGIFATTGSNGFNGNQSITGSLTVTGQVVAQTLNVQQVTSSIVYSSGSNVFGNELGNTQQFTGSVSITGSLTTNGTSTFNNNDAPTIRIQRDGGTNGNTVIEFTNESNSFFIGSNGTEMGLGGTNGSIGSQPLRISSTGATTFSNIVSVGYDSSNRSTIRLTSNAANRQAAIYFYGNNAESAVLGYEGGSEIVGGGIQGDFVIRNVLANKHIILTTNNGNVGIGTLTPTGKLSVEATGNHITLRAPGATAGKYWALDVSSANQFYIINNAGTQYLTITDSGNVGIGAPSPSQRLHVANSAGGVVAFLQSTATNGEPSLNLEGRNSSGTVRNGVFKYDNADLLRIGTSSPIDFRFETNDVERMRIDSAGTVQVKSGNELRVYRSDNARYGTFYTDNNYVHIAASTDPIKISSPERLEFHTSGNERMRITSGGDVGIGTTNVTGRLVVSADDSQYVLRSQNASASLQNQFYIQHNLANVILGNNRGTVTYGNPSDYRLKEDLQELNGLEKISQIKIYNYKWKTSDDRMDGVLAHELQEIIPYAVTGVKDELYEDETEKIQNVDYSKLVPVLVKAIQEQQSQIESLKSRIEILEQ